VHIGLCSPQWPPAGAANGIVSYVSVVRDCLLSQGHQVSIIAGGRLFDAQDNDQLLVPQAPGKPPAEPWHARIAKRFRVNEGALPAVGRSVAEQVRAARKLVPLDLVEMEESFGWCDTVRRKAGIPVVARLHGPAALSPALERTGRERRADRQRIAAEGRALQAAQSLTSPTRAVMGAACDRYGIRPRGLRAVIPNPVLLAPAALRWRPETCDPYHVLMVGRFDRSKGADTMLQAFDHLLDRQPKARLTLVGPDAGIKLEPGRTADFAAYAATNLSARTRARITFTGTLPPAEIARLRRSAFVSVVASRSESYCYALVEGLAAGCPTISTAWNGSDEIIVDGATGILTPVGDPKALASKIDWLMTERATACRLAEAGFERCRNFFSAEAVGAQLVDHYEATLEAVRPA
jgi:glycosyltransferase involved in cell wall biosynthesis